MTDYTSSGLGWTAGQNVSSQIATFFNSTAQAGDSLHLAHRFQINRATTGQLTIPANFTLSAADNGGFDSLTAETGSLTIQFTVSAGVLLDNLTVRMLNAPNTGTTSLNPVAGTDYMRHEFLRIQAANVEIRNCDFEGQISHWLRTSGATDNFLCRGTRISGGFWAVYMLGDTFAPRFEDSYFSDTVGEMFKTVLNSNKVLSGWVGSRSDGITKNVLRCQFVDNARDGIDTTGGLRNWIIEDSFFINCGVDIKVPLKEAPDPLLASQTVWTQLEADGLPVYGPYNITFNRCLFTGHRKFIAVLDTRDDPWLQSVTVADFQRLVPKKIRLNDCQWYLPDSTPVGDLMLLKSADDIVVSNLTRYGEAQGEDIFALINGSLAPWAPGWSPLVGLSATGTTNVAGAPPSLGGGWYKIDPDAPIEGPGDIPPPEDPPPVPILLQSTTINVTANGISPPSVTMAFAQTGYAAGAVLTLADLVADITQAGDPPVAEGDLTLTLIVGGSPVSLPYTAVEGASMVARATWSPGTQTANSGAIVVVAAVALTAVVTAQATIEFTGAGLITHRYSSPSPYASVDVGFGAGEVRYNPSDLPDGPISVIPARIKFTSGRATPGGVIGLPSVWDATAYGGIWVHNGATATLARKFQRNNVDIVGATGDTYTLVEADVGSSVTMVETLTDDVGSTSQSTNALTIPDTENWDISVGDGTYTINGFPPVPLTPAWSISVGDGTYTINSFPGGS